MTVTRWPVIAIDRTTGTPAAELQLGEHRFPLTRADATTLMGNLAEVLNEPAPGVRLGVTPGRRRTLDEIIGGDQ